MNIPWRLTRQKKILFIAVCLVLSGCGSFRVYLNRQTTSGNDVVVHYNTTSQYYSNERPELGFVSYNYIFWEFVDEYGKKRNELTSTLGVTVVDHPDTCHYYTVYAGLNIYYYSYTIKIIQLGLDSQSLFTKIFVIEPTQAKSSIYSHYNTGALDPFISMDWISTAGTTIHGISYFSPTA